ncbi:amidase domain-containing protein [Ornithinibacillus sp. BX22]|uniref:Amidase domain-containing protein n=1 Tax=Ornithinibacillus hominis TaxID=2763055 RepID=A0A923L4X2_9BACI|nr:amidase domain-containing protein [Ornithinibacillus hominis]MBC5636553.1 amidase domain-containing protein [Ornithinibacillus hominis]
MNILEKFWLELFESNDPKFDWIESHKLLHDKRNVKLVRVHGKGHIYQRMKYDQEEKVYYHLHLTMLLKQGDHFTREERTIPYEFILKNGNIIDHKQTLVRQTEEPTGKLEPDSGQSEYDRFSYDRLAAVQYAERWWNSYNPQYRKFDVDCTNYVSQCLRAGGAPMRGAPNRNQGWWYTGDNWSYSWAVAHSLRWFLAGSTHGLKGTEVDSASELQPGDVICYDFQGDGRWDHTTIVVAKDRDGMPLVNAHTQNSRHRYWSYEDSSAYTPNIKYKFFRIGD